MKFLLDPGHGGIINGQYQTAGKRSPVWPDKRQLFEGEFNRDIVSRIINKCNNASIQAINIVPELTDITLGERVRRANEIFKSNKDCIFISVHANAGGGTGFEFFTTPGQTTSDKYAQIIIDEFEKELPELKLRADKSDGDEDKEAHFYVIKNTLMPAMLIECAFMDTLIPDCELMMSEEGKERMASAIFKGMIKIHTNSN